MKNIVSVAIYQQTFSIPAALPGGRPHIIQTMGCSNGTLATGMKFRFEDELYGVLRREMLRLIPDDSGPVRALVERGVGAVIPDVIIVASGEDSALRREARPLTMFEATILAELSPDEWKSPDEVADRLFTQAGRVRSALNRLTGLRLAVRNEDDEFGVLESLLPAYARIVSIEAKLRRWREAVDQAKSYLPFSDQAYVALPAAITIGNRALRDSALNAGVGIVAVGEDSIDVQLEAPKHSERRGEWLWLYTRTGTDWRGGPSSSQRDAM